MFKKIYDEMDLFVSNIKTNGQDDLLVYINSSLSSSVKLLMFASKTFSMYAKIVLFFIISLSGLLVLSVISTGAPSIGILTILLLLFVFLISFILQSKKYLILGIENSKNSIVKE